VQPAGLVSPRWRDDGVTQKPQQLRHGDRDQPGVQAGAGLLPALHCHGNGEVDVGQQADRGPAVPGFPADDLPGVQAGTLLCELVIFFDGLITNGKFCCVRRVQLSLTWWRRPVRLRGSALHTDVDLVGEPDDPDLDRLPPVQPAPGERRWDRAYQLLARSLKLCGLRRVPGTGIVDLPHDLSGPVPGQEPPAHQRIRRRERHRRGGLAPGRSTDTAYPRATRVSVPGPAAALHMQPTGSSST
jgi:hypothetical protein